MRKFYLLFLGVIMACSVDAQLDTVTRFNQVIQDLEVFDSKLFIGGNFTQNEGSTCYWSAYYNGSSVTRHTGAIGGGGARELEVFDNELYNVGSMQLGFGIGVGVWSGSTWNDGGSTNYSHSTMYADGNTLYVESDDGVVRSKPAGGSFTTFYDFQGNGGLSSIMRYGNNLVFAGSFTSMNGVTASNIIQWDGNNWTALGAGLDGGAGAMYVYNNELYVAGSFNMAGSTAVDGIAKWNGTSWSDVGGGLAGSSFSSGINDMVEHNGLLYVSGRFDVIGGQNADDLAYWNGSSWTGINWPHPELSFRSIEVYNGDIYLGGYDFNTSRLYRYLGGVGIEDQENTFQLSVYPNPSNGWYTINVDGNPADYTYVVMNSLGQEVLAGHSLNVDLSAHDPGLYFLRVMSGEASKTIRLIKE